MTVFKDTTKLAEAAILLADQILKGQAINIPGAELASGDLTSIGDTGKKVVKAYLLEPVIITKSNISVPVDAKFYTDAEAAQLR
jgi:putative multiple sugar transport system substrate-binding protein